MFVELDPHFSGVSNGWAEALETAIAVIGAKWLSFNVIHKL